jgi:predicted protein tyrosine phosphatase
VAHNAVNDFGRGSELELDLTICDASEVVELVKAHERDNTSFGLVISIEGPADGVEGRAPRLTKEIGPEWTDRQVILFCNDVETGASVPEPQLVQSALDHFEKRRPASGVLRVLVHCRRGKSRSTAVGLVLLRHHRGPGTESECLEELIRIRPVAAPNIAIVQHGDALLGCEGALIQAMVRAGAAVTALAVLSDAQASAGRFDEALATIERSLIFAKRSAIELQSVLWRRGELHLRCGDATEAERDFRESLEITRHIGSKGYELRATTSLARLLAKEGRHDEARAMLAEIYGWFTEGFDTADLKDAKALLDELSA